MADNVEIPPSNDVIQVISHVTRDELMSLKISLANKRLIVAICENDRGRFIKLTDGRGRIIVPSDGIPHMRESLSALETNLDPSLEQSASSTIASAAPGQPNTNPSSGSTAAAAAVANAAQQHQQQQQQQPATAAAVGGSTNPAINTNNVTGNSNHAGNEEHRSELVDSQRFICEGRKFYFDVLDNARGRYLKISQSSTRRVTLIVPLVFLPSITRAIDMLMEKAPPDATIVQDPSTVQRITRSIERVTALGDGSSATLNIVQREVRTMGKRVIFESGANRRGSYIKIIENSGSQRMTVMLPHAAVPEIINLLQEVVADGDPAQALNPQNGQ